MNQKKILTLVIFLIVGASLLNSTLAQQESAKELFEKAIYLEETKGDLEGAMALFQKVATNFPENRVLAAQALFHIGTCYEKLGNREAQKAFQNVIDKYPDQAATVKMAREKLSAFASTKTPPPPDDQSLSIKQIWSGRGVDTTGAVSSDGKYYAFTDWTTGDLAIRDLATGKNRRLTDKGPWTKSMAFALFPKWSLDGQSIVYDWFNYEGEYFELHVLTLKDLKPKALYHSNENEYIMPFNFHPDGERALVAFYKRGKTCDLGLVSVKDGSIEKLKTFDKQNGGTSVWGFALSPDGRTLAYDNQYQGDPKTRDIFLYFLDSKEEIRLIGHPSIDRVLDWTADGRYLLFFSQRTGSRDMYVVRVEGGKTVGDPTLVKANIDIIFPLGCTQTDQFFYGLQGLVRDIYLAEIDPDSGKFLTTPIKQPLIYEGCNITPNYSPDGRTFAYISMRDDLPMSKNALCIFSFDTNEIRELEPELDEFYSPQWRPDKQAITLLGIEEDVRYGIYQIDLGSEEVSPLIQVPEDERIFAHRWSSDGSTIYYTKSKTKRNSPSQIYVFDMKSGQSRALPGSPQDARDIDVSFDGQWIAFMNRSLQGRRLGIIPTAGGEAQELYKLAVTGEGRISAAWSPNGKYIYFSYRELPSQEEWDMWRFSLETKQAEKLSPKDLSFRHMNIHPDGRHMIMSTEASPSQKTGVWVIENLLSKLEKKK